jgi:hypothetical protein
VFISEERALPLTELPSETASQGPDDGILNEMGWAAAALLIVGSSLALASLAWFLIGLIVGVADVDLQLFGAADGPRLRPALDLG